jgi:predicted alpha/beta-fold hydrolase
LLPPRVARAPLPTLTSPIFTFILYPDAMPLIPSNFCPPRYLRHHDIQTILPSIARRARKPSSEILPLQLDDGDILITRLRTNRASRLAIVSHGLEGSFDRAYITGMSDALTSFGWDVLTWNMRGCGGTPNKLVTWYHSGKSDDLRAVVRYAQTLSYSEISLIGFSVGGNITLKYLGEEGRALARSITKAVAISVPTDLQGSAEKLAKGENAVYMRYLLHPLRRRMREKSARFPGIFDISGLDRIKTFREFDARFTAPFHGFSSVEEYWDRSSSRNYLSTISIPTLVLSALDDPFLSESCFPFALAETHSHLFLETPSYGGHVGFLDSLRLSRTWLEERVARFLENPSPALS